MSPKERYAWLNEKKVRSHLHENLQHQVKSVMRIDQQFKSSLMLASKTLLMLHGLLTPGEARRFLKKYSRSRSFVLEKRQMHTYRGYTHALRSSLQFSQCSLHVLEPGLFFDDHALG